MVYFIQEEDAPQTQWNTQYEDELQDFSYLDLFHRNHSEYLARKNFQMHAKSSESNMKPKTTGKDFIVKPANVVKKFSTLLSKKRIEFYIHIKLETHFSPRSSKLSWQARSVSIQALKWTKMKRKPN